MSDAKTMTRSRNQLATSYAPESFFTFEGGRGACIVRSCAGERIDLSESTRDLIFERMGELGRAWYDSAMRARENMPSKPQPLPVQCVDAPLLTPGSDDFQVPGQDRFALCKPSHMEYSPAPLSFVCRTCHLFRDYESLAALDKDLPNLVPERCPHPKSIQNCDWEQLDVIFVHWSGRWEAPFPGTWDWTQERKLVKRRDSCICGSTLFKLNRRSPGVGDWFFECAVCDKPLNPKWLLKDRDTMSFLGPQAGPDRITDMRMQATPYRASSAYYVKSDLFIDFKEGGQQLLQNLRPGREASLKDFVASAYGFAMRPMTDDDVRKACEGKAECAKDLVDYLGATSQIETITPLIASAPETMRAALQGAVDLAHRTKQRVLDDLRRRQILIPKVDLPDSVTDNIRQRQSRFASKFDPFRLAIEHATLTETRLNIEKRINGKKPYVSFTRLDDDLSPDDRERVEPLQQQTRTLLDKLGLDDMGLIREFDLCRFSFAYSRMESTPVLRDKRGLDMPVRLNLFPPVWSDESRKYPIYVVQQGNEALYVRLRESAVLGWLQTLGCDDMFNLNDGERIGAGLLASAQPMRPFLDDLPESPAPPVFLYLYTLLHSFSHLLMRYISEYSGLDQGSLGEYIFPADLAFVVYRNGTTMDLGNLSALWRNSGTAMLSAMLGTKATQCGTGSLCTERGGACPDCVMVPETSCIAGNKLLSRSVLRSIGGRPRLDKRITPIKGYLDFVAAGG